jgi:hypothetical protein
MSEHFIVKCKNCGSIISQCRCMDLNKTVRYSTCDKCANKNIKCKTK